MREVEFTGTDIDEALKNASDELKLTADNLHFDIITLGSKGLFGKIGKRPARIKVYLKDKKGSSSSNERKPAEKKFEKKRERPDKKREKKRDNDRNRNKRREEKEPRAAVEPQEEKEAHTFSDGDKPEEVKKVEEFVARLAKALDDGADVSAGIINGKLNIIINSDNTGRVIGRGGNIINSLEYLAIKYSQKVFQERIKVIVKVEGGDRKSSR